jgi:hypothetical protein
MSMIQTLLKRLLPARWSSEMEAETRKWMLQCPCGHEANLWDAGGVRYKARGTKWTVYRCPTCGLQSTSCIIVGSEFLPILPGCQPQADDTLSVDLA